MPDMVQHFRIYSRAAPLGLREAPCFGRNHCRSQWEYIRKITRSKSVIPVSTSWMVPSPPTAIMVNWVSLQYQDQEAYCCNAGGMSGVSGKAVLKGNADEAFSCLVQIRSQIEPASAGTRIGIYDKIIHSSS